MLKTNDNYSWHVFNSLQLDLDPKGCRIYVEYCHERI